MNRLYAVTSVVADHGSRTVKVSATCSSEARWKAHQEFKNLGEPRYVSNLPGTYHVKRVTYYD